MTDVSVNQEPMNTPSGRTVGARQIRRRQELAIHLPHRRFASHQAPGLDKPKSRALLTSQDRHKIHAHCRNRGQHRRRAGGGGEGQDGGREALRIGRTDANQKTRDKAPADS
jgi:hypothetical protein